MTPRALLLLSLSLAAAAGCARSDGDDSSPSGTGDSDADADTDTDTDTDGVVDTLPDEGELYGTYPANPIPAPDFAATNRDGTARARADLLGHPTVMWFFPAAGTYG